VAQSLCVPHLKTIYVSFCRGCHGHSSKRDRPIVVAINARPWKLTDHRYMAAILDENLLKSIEPFRITGDKCHVMIAFGKVLCGTLRGANCPSVVCGCVHLPKAHVSALPRAFRDYCHPLASYRRVPHRLG
jgi:hypothetical protein